MTSLQNGQHRTYTFICIWNNSICKPPNLIRVPYSFQFITRVLDGLLFLCINKQELWRGNLRPSAQHRYHSKSFTQVSDFPPHLLGENIPAFIKEVGVVVFFSPKYKNSRNNKKKQVTEEYLLSNKPATLIKKKHPRIESLWDCVDGSIATVCQMFQSDTHSVFPLHVTAVMWGHEPSPGVWMLVQSLWNFFNFI